VLSHISQDEASYAGSKSIMRMIASLFPLFVAPSVPSFRHVHMSPLLAVNVRPSLVISNDPRVHSQIMALDIFRTGTLAPAWKVLSRTRIFLKPGIIVSNSLMVFLATPSSSAPNTPLALPIRDLMLRRVPTSISLCDPSLARCALLSA